MGIKTEGAYRAYRNTILATRYKTKLQSKEELDLNYEPLDRFMKNNNLCRTQVKKLARKRVIFVVKMSGRYFCLLNPKVKIEELFYYL